MIKINDQYKDGIIRSIEYIDDMIIITIQYKDGHVIIERYRNDII